MQPSSPALPRRSIVPLGMTKTKAEMDALLETDTGALAQVLVAEIKPSRDKDGSLWMRKEPTGFLVRLGDNTDWWRSADSDTYEQIP